MVSFEEVLDSTRVTDRSFTEETVEVDALQVVRDGVEFNGRRSQLPPSAKTRLYRSFHAPVDYLGKMSPDTQRQVTTDHLKVRRDFGGSVRVVERNGQTFAICPSNLVQLSATDVLTAMGEGLNNNLDGLLAAKVDDDGERLEAQFVSPRKSIEVRRGDVVQAGIHLVHYRFGQQATKFESFIYRLVCENGAVRRECVSDDGIVRTRKMPTGHPHGRDLQLDQIRRLTAKTWESLDPQLTELRATNERTVDVEALIRQWLQRARMSQDRLMPGLLNAWRQEGGENTQYGAVNAITRVATHGLQDQSLSRRQRGALASLGGLLAFSHVHLCPRCFTVLSSAANGGTDSNLRRE